MMQICNDNKDTKPGHEWEYNDMINHQEKMLDIAGKKLFEEMAFAFDEDIEDVRNRFLERIKLD